ncbi:VPA1269 family protein [Mesorhizobium captivum]|uniref:VPA1269 family protein n=1 Tax=Mesorhizobium captivum TaxID=3072319 RepID=UPI002A239FA5|nr:VPA1269 family protein [Mesorhizobium sp. VK22E]MDX8506132.1 VPA1269 family protein [Mesorhizobium sp. VK22E]
MSPHLFTKRSAERITFTFANEILSQCALGKSLKKALKKAGLFAFLDRLDPRTVVTYRAHLDGLLASLCMAINGVEDAADIPVEAFEFWLSHFRTQDGFRWRGDLWGPGQATHFQCLKEVVTAFARFSNTPELVKHSGQVRLQSNGTDTWKFFRARAQEAQGVEAEWLSFYDDWTSGARVSRSDSQLMLRSICEWSKINFPSSSVAEIMATQQRSQKLSAKIESGRGGRRNTSNILRLTARFSTYVEDTLRSLGVKDALWPLVTKSDQAKAQHNDRANGGGSKSSESRSNPLPPYLFPIVEEILEEGENGWPGKCSLFQETYLDARGNPQRVYCPVIPIFFQILLILPLRGVQLNRFDSGEGDLNLFDGSARTWIENDGEAAGYWRRHEGKSTPDRGYARKVGNEPEQITGFFINTNKTGEPYVIPWEQPKAQRLLSYLRVWQGEHYPIRTPMSPDQYVRKDEKLDDDSISLLPSIFPLFRLPAGRRGHVPGAPPSWRRRDQAWQEVMLETERRWNERNPTRQIKIVKRQQKTGQPYGALYNVHGLRVAGLTRLFMSGVPIEILSKVIAGHAGLIMTLYYLKFKPADIHRILEEAREKAPALSQEFMESFRHWAFDEAKRKAVALDDSAIQAAVEQEPANKLMYSDVTYGMCPWAGTRCSDGGQAIPGTKNNKGQFRHGPVEGGEKNCIMCRHFISGPAYMNQLWLFGVTLFERFSQTALRIEALEKQRETSIAAQLSANTERERRSQQTHITALEIQIDALSSANVLLLKAVARTKRVLEMCEQIRQDAQGRSGVDLIVQDNAPVVELMEISEFERTVIITASTRLFPMMHDGETEARLQAFLDKILWEAGKTPLTFAPLSEDQKRFGRDELARLLMEKLDRAETQALVEGRLTLHDVGLAPEVDRLLDLPAPLYSGSIEHEAMKSM